METETDVTIVVILDEPGTRLEIARMLTTRGYRVVGAPSTETGLELLRSQRAACLVLDLNLPGRSGLELLPDLAELDSPPGVVVLTGERAAPVARAGKHGGVAEYLTRPFAPTELAAAVARALEQRRARQELEEVRRWLEEEIAERDAAAAKERHRLEQLARSSLEVLVTALEAKDRFMAGHSMRVADLAASVAAELGRPDDEIEQIRQAGRLHDLGMIGISDSILNKEGPLTAGEVAQIRQHPIMGDQLLRMHPELAQVALFVRSHHERWDGTGYPDGLAGAAIPQGGRILAAAEVYDALVTDRVYRNSHMNPEEACRHIGRLAGTALDPTVCAALAKVTARRHALEFVVEPDPTNRERLEIRASRHPGPGGRKLRAQGGEIEADRPQPGPGL